MAYRLSRYRLGLAVTSALVAIGIFGLTAPASASADQIVDHLISSSTANGLGFPTVFQKPISSHATQSAICTNGAEVAFVNSKTSLGLVDEILHCRSSSAATSYLASHKSQIKPDSSLNPPKSLGQSALGSSAKAPLFVYYWTRGSYVAIVGLDTDATSNSAQANAGKHNPLTKDLTGRLNSAAEEQDALIR